MQVPYGEGSASHTGPESCVVTRKGGGEALTGERTGRVLSREIQTLQAADALGSGERPHRVHRQREMHVEPARSKTPSTHGNITPGSREIPRPPVGKGADQGESARAYRVPDTEPERRAQRDRAGTAGSTRRQ